MDLKAFDTTGNETSRLYLTLPDGTKLIDEASGEQLWMDVISSDSKEFKQAEHNVTTAKLQRATRRGKVTVTGQQVDGEALDLQARAVKDFGPEGVWQLDGETLTPGFDSNLKILKRLPFIREQVDDHINDRTNWLGN